jgi:hypothetical protein
MLIRDPIPTRERHHPTIREVVQRLRNGEGEKTTIRHLNRKLLGHRRLLGHLSLLHLSLLHLSLLHLSLLHLSLLHLSLLHLSLLRRHKHLLRHCLLRRLLRRCSTPHPVNKHAR